MTHGSFAVIVASVGFTAVVTAAVPSPRLAQPPAAPASAARDLFPDTPGKSAMMEGCTGCHSAESAVQMMLTREQWVDKLERMLHWGAQLSDDQYDQILAYLLKHFSPIHINKDTAKDLEISVDVPAKVAEAIVAARVQTGGFRTLDDLAKVPGLEATTIEGRKARILF